MGISASLVMVAIGAILKYALPGSVLGINLGVIGLILMVVGVVGLAISLLIWAPWRQPPAGPDDVIEERRVYGRRPPY
jgi:hypothetical protein